jgi:hypothetical protein
VKCEFFDFGPPKSVEDFKNGKKRKTFFSYGEVIDSRNDAVIEDSAIPKSKYGIGQQVVDDYGTVGHFQCACLFL